MFYFDCAIKHKVNDSDSKTKKFHYMFTADTYSEAEKKCYKIMELNSITEFSIDVIKKTDINEYNVENPDSNKFFISTVAMIVPDYDEEEKEKQVDKCVHIIRSSDIGNVPSFLYNLYSSQDIAIQHIKRVNIVEMYMDDDFKNVRAVPVTDMI